MIIEKIGNSRTQPYIGVVVAAFPTLNPPEIKMKHYIAKIAVVILSGFAVLVDCEPVQAQTTWVMPRHSATRHFTWARPAASSHCQPIHARRLRPRHRRHPL